MIIGNFNLEDRMVIRDPGGMACAEGSPAGLFVRREARWATVTAVVIEIVALPTSASELLVHLPGHGQENAATTCGHAVMTKVAERS